MRVTGSEEIGSLKVLGLDIIGEIYFFMVRGSTQAYSREERSKDRSTMFIPILSARCLSQVLGQVREQKEGVE